MPEEGDTIKIYDRVGVVTLVREIEYTGCSCCWMPGYFVVTYPDGSTEHFYEGDDYEVV